MDQPDSNLTQGIFYNGQIFDAYHFITILIKKARKKIIIIDNYIDESILVLLSKRKKGVPVTIFTSKITRALQLDIEKFNQQYSPLEIKLFKLSHDRFVIIDDKEIYHIGASLKDLGKKWFGFSKLDHRFISMLKKLESQI